MTNGSFGDLEVLAHVADEVRQVGGVLGGGVGVDHVVPALEPDEAGEFVALAGVVRESASSGSPSVPFTSSSIAR